MDAVEELFVNAPKLPTPVPFRVSGLAVLSVNPFRSKAAPDALTVVADEVPSAVVDPSLSVPALMVVVREYVFTPESVHVPVPALTIARAPAIAVVTLPPAEPPKVMVIAELTGTPVMAIVPASPTTLAAAVNVITPLYVDAVEELLVNAPKPPTPVPVIERASVAADVNENPFRSSDAPVAETVVPPAVVPSGPDVESVEDAPNFKVPALTVVVPV